MTGPLTVLPLVLLIGVLAGCCESSSSDEHFYQPRYSNLRSDARHVCIEDSIMYDTWKQDDAYWTALKDWHRWAAQYADDATVTEQRYGSAAPSLDSMKEAVC